MLSLSLLIAAALAITVTALNNGVGKLPAMGYDTFNAFSCNYNSSNVLAQANAMKKRGSIEAGYKFIILDDCYALKNRSADGSLVADPENFPKVSRISQRQSKLWAYPPALTRTLATKRVLAIQALGITRSKT